MVISHTGVESIRPEPGNPRTTIVKRIPNAILLAGGEVKLDVYPEMQHVFQMAAGNMPEADEAVARIAAWLRPRLGLA